MPHWRKELTELSARDPRLGEEAAEIGRALHDVETDRGCALVGASLTENALREIIRIHAFQAPNTDLDDIFGFEAPLGTFSAKIKIAYAFGMIDKKIRDDCDRIRVLRNAFAHSRVPINFKTSAVTRGCSGFHAPHPAGMSEYLQSVNPARRTYVNVVMALVHMSGLALLSFARGHRHKAMRVLTYDEAGASRDRWWQQLQQRNRPNPRSGDKKKVRDAPPRSSKE